MFRTEDLNTEKMSGKEFIKRFLRDFLKLENLTEDTYSEDGVAYLLGEMFEIDFAIVYGIIVDGLSLKDCADKLDISYESLMARRRKIRKNFLEDDYNRKIIYGYAKPFDGYNKDTTIEMLKDIPIRVLNLKPTTCTYLKNRGITMISDLTKFSLDELRYDIITSEKIYDEVEDTLDCWGLLACMEEVHRKFPDLLRWNFCIRDFDEAMEKAIKYELSNQPICVQQVFKLLYIDCLTDDEFEDKLDIYSEPAEDAVNAFVHKFLSDYKRTKYAAIKKSKNNVKD